MNLNNNFKVAPSIFNAYEICHYQAWLMLRNLNADQENPFIKIGNLLDEITYKKEKRTIMLANFPAKIDMFYKENGNYFIAEIKKSSKSLDSAVWQLKYYLYILKKSGIDFNGKLKIPKERKSFDIILNDDDIIKIEKTIIEIINLTKLELPPIKKRIRFCSSCGHNEFCWS